MAKRLYKKLEALKENQLAAVDPEALVWLRASAGTGKTHVLTSRVLRLLLRPDVQPETVLCLTFTKAGAAEMAERISTRLAHWVQIPDTDLAADLLALGEHATPEVRARARTLFAQVLDARGGGLRIQTIHSFCQSLLAAFPVEAGLAPGFRAIDEREQKALARSALADLVIRAEREGNRRLIETLQALSVRMGEGDAEAFLTRCGRAGDALEALPSGIRPWLRRALDLPSGGIEEALADACADPQVDCETLDFLVHCNRAWGKARGLDRCDRIAAWRALAPAERAAQLAELNLAWATKKGDPASTGKGYAPQDEGYAEAAAKMHAWASELIALGDRVAFADLFADALEAGRTYARAYEEAKRVRGLVDYDDLIARTVRLLRTSNMAEWIRFKLDQATDHILVDEGQDTNVAQWAIIDALASEYFAGIGAKDDKVRTLFTVGDYKQAIFGFQGTSPMAFEAARRHFEGQAQEAERPFSTLSLFRSFRTTPAVLEVVDRVISEVGPENFGLGDTPETHRSARGGPGRVLLLDAVQPTVDAEEESEGAEDWLSDSTRVLATQLARQIREWIEGGMMLESEGRPLTAGDVMILVRRRSALARLIVARLYEEGVPVAGIDRLRLSAPLAVRDLLAAVRFVLQPEDDLNLAALLVSPLIGWSQEELYARGRREKGVRLWAHLRENADRALLEPLLGLLRQADFTTAYRFLESILSGEMDGRKKLVERLGTEARDPIEELLNAALAFEARYPPSLQMFLDWLDRDDSDVVRDAAATGGAVRVLTVHGAKGLEAPLVILADATIDPENGRRSTAVEVELGEDPLPIPMPVPRRHERFGAIAGAVEKADREERQEHWRLLYVAMTRAQEVLVVTGALGKRVRAGAESRTWFGAVERALEGLSCAREESERWKGMRMFRGTLPQAAASRRSSPVEAPPPAPDLPEWALRPAPAEARPPVPLAPSAQEEDESPYPPPGPTLRAAAERGRLLHSLFERLPDVPQPGRGDAALRWLAHAAPDRAEEDRVAIAAAALQVIEAPEHAALFSLEALAEAPIAAVVGGMVVSGTVDRLLVRPDEVLVADFKTGRSVPQAAEDIPRAHLRQMAAYRAALRVIFPDRPVRAMLLYSEGPRLFTLPDALLDPHKPGYGEAQESLAGVA